MSIFQKLCLFLLIAGNNALYSQGENPNDILLQFDQPFYTIGEKIGFKAYLSGLAGEANLLHIAVYDQQGKEMDYQVQMIEEQQASGILEVGLDWKEDHYQMLAWVNTSTGLEIPFWSRYLIPIYNDLIDYSERPFTKETTIPARSAVENYTLSVSADRTDYQPRENIQLTIKAMDRNGQPVQANLALSVVNERLAGRMTLFPSPQQSFAADNAVFSDPGKFEQGMVFRGLLRYKATNEPKPITLLTAMTRERVEFHLAKTNESGFFILETPPFEGTRSLQIQDVNLFENDRDSKVVPVIARPPLMKGNPSTLAFTPAIKKYLEASRERKKFNQIFHLDTAAVIRPEWSIPDYPTPNRSYPINDYVAFKDLEEFLKEVVLPLRIRERKGVKTVRLMREETKEFYELMPLILLDNQIVENRIEFLKRPISGIEKVDLYINSQDLKDHFGVMGRWGVIHVHSKVPDSDQKLNSFTFPLRGLSPTRDYPTKSYPEMELNAQRTPDFRPILHWAPVVRTDENGIATVTFSSSDDIDTYRVLVGGMVNKQLIENKTCTIRISQKN